MQLTISLVLVLLLGANSLFCSNAQSNITATASTRVQGMDVSSNQPNVDWKAAYKKGARFAYVKATEGTTYRNPLFAQQYTGSYRVGMIRGAYHFGRPDGASGAAQARFFVGNGGRWSGDGKTLPGALDIEYNPVCARRPCTASQKCYGKTKRQMGAWIKSFVQTYKQLTGVYPVIYTTTDWYNSCVGTYGDLSSKCPLWIACYGCRTPLKLPYNWKVYKFWQTADKGKFPGDQNVFNGPYSQLVKFAKQK